MAAIIQLSSLYVDHWRIWPYSKSGYCYKWTAPYLVVVKILDCWPLMTSHDLKWPLTPKIKMNPLRTFSQLSKNIWHGGGHLFLFLTFNDLSRPQMTSDLKNQNVKVKCIITTKTGNVLKQAEVRCVYQNLAPNSICNDPGDVVLTYLQIHKM